MTVITTPMMCTRHGDDVRGSALKQILVYEDCISQPNRNVKNRQFRPSQLNQPAAAQIEREPMQTRRRSRARTGKGFH